MAGRLSFDAYWCGRSRRRLLLLLLLHDGEGDVECSQSLAEEGLGQLGGGGRRQRGAVEDKEGLLDLDALVHLRHHLHRVLTIRRTTIIHCAVLLIDR